VAQHQPFRRGGPATHHVLVAAADVGSEDLEDDPVLALAIAECQFGERNAFDGDLAGAAKDDAAIGGR